MLRLDEYSAGRDNGGNCFETRCPHRLARFHQIDNAVCDAQRASRLDTAANVLDNGLELRIAVGAGTRLLCLQLPKVLFGEVGEAGNDVLSNQVLGLGQVAFGRDLHLETAFSETQVEDFVDTRCGRGRRDAFMLGDLVTAGYA